MSSELKVKVKFFSPQNGGRSELSENLLSNGVYRPHFVVIDINGNSPEDYLGVAFIDQSDILISEKEVLATVVKMYDGVDYSKLTNGVNFTIREGEAIIGSGTVVANDT